METHQEQPSVAGGIRAEVTTVSWRAISLHAEMMVWVKCSSGATAWTLPLKVLPTLAIFELVSASPAGTLSDDIRLAAHVAAARYVAKNRPGLKEMFRQSY